MTKRNLVYTLGVICAGRKYCGFKKPKHTKGDINICKYQHFVEVAKPGRIYDRVFDTTRPEMYMKKIEDITAKPVIGSNIELNNKESIEK